MKRASDAVQSLLSADQILYLDEQSSALVLCAAQEPPRIVRFSLVQWRVVQHLMHSFPAPSQQAALLSIVFESSEEACAHMLTEASAQGSRAVMNLVRPMRAVLSQCRARLHPLTLSISTVRGKGYILVAGASRYERPYVSA